MEDPFMMTVTCSEELQEQLKQIKENKNKQKDYAASVIPIKKNSKNKVSKFRDMLVRSS